MTARDPTDPAETTLLEQMLAQASAEQARAKSAHETPPIPLPTLADVLSEKRKPIRETLSSEIDSLVSGLAREILAQPEVQRLHEAWRGLRGLVDQIDVRENIQVAFFHCSKQELADDFEAASSVTESALYRRLCERDPGPSPKLYAPVSLIVADYEFEHHQHEIELLTDLAAVAADAHAPLIANAAPAFFECEAFWELSAQADVRKLLESLRYAAWESFRDNEDARYLALCVPKTSHAFVAHVAASFARTRGFASLTGESEVSVAPLDLPAEAVRDLSDGGFVVCVGDEADGSRFASASAAYRPRRFADTSEGRAAAASSRAAVELSNTLTISRLAHFMEAIAMEMPSQTDVEGFQRALHRWLSSHGSRLLELTHASHEARVVVSDAGYLRYELTVRNPDGARVEVAGRLD